MEKNRFWIGIGLVLAIVITASFIVVERDTIFQNNITILYFSGCKENFINDVLISEECTEDRALVEQQNNPQGEVSSELMRLIQLNIT